MTTEAFEDFYGLLEIKPLASPEEIRRAFRARMREWHPDVNPSPDATAHTQRLIVAYKILNDPVAKTHYDAAHAKHFRRATDGSSQTSTPSGAPRGASPSQPTPDFSDPVLERWIRTARKEAAEEWRQFASEFKGASMAALGAAGRMLVMMIIFSIIGLLLLLVL